jgi:hypothetical protein
MVDELPTAPAMYLVMVVELSTTLALRQVMAGELTKDAMGKLSMYIMTVPSPLVAGPREEKLLEGLTYLYLQRSSVTAVLAQFLVCNTGLCFLGILDVAKVFSDDRCVLSFFMWVQTKYAMISSYMLQ